MKASVQIILLLAALAAARSAFARDHTLTFPFKGQSDPTDITNLDSNGKSPRKIPVQTKRSETTGSMTKGWVTTSGNKRPPAAVPKSTPPTTDRQLVPTGKVKKAQKNPDAHGTNYFDALPAGNGTDFEPVR